MWRTSYTVKGKKRKIETMKLKFGVEEKRKIVFLDVEIKRGEREERISTKWFRKKEDSGIMCNWRSDVDRSTKRNIMNNLEKKIEKLTTEEGEKKRLKESMWGF